MRLFSPLFALLAIACSEASREAISVAPVFTAGQHAVDVTGVGRAATRTLGRLAPNDSAWTRLFAVYVDAVRNADTAASASRTPPVLGQYAASAGRVRFTPKFPFVAGVSYRIDVDTAALGRFADQAAQPGTGPAPPPLVHRFSIPAVALERTTRVLAVHPALPRLPSNLLRWYVEFSAPMEPGSALAHVHLMDEAGREVPGAFLALDQELWDAERRRLTLLFDPGRVKRAIRTNLEVGAPLVAGRRYTLAIDDQWPDGTGAPIASGYRLAFEAVEADRRSPDPSRWRLATPTAATRAPLRVAFGEPLDHALASRMVSVHDSSGRSLAGSAQIAEGDSVWTFAPSAAWAAGTYALHVDRALEDVAGNNISRLFDVDRRAGNDTLDGAPVRTVPFRILLRAQLLKGAKSQRALNSERR
jgi:hypothetical protein